MRMFVIKKGTDLRSVGADLLKSGAANTAGGQVTIDRIRELNPHVDFERLEPGTVLLLPESAEIKAEGATSVGGEAFDGFVGEVQVGLENSGDRIRQGFARVAEDRRAVAAALRGATLKRVIEGDPALKAQLEAADAALKEEVKRGAEAEETLKKARESAMRELAELRRLFE